ncbi:hypothetical protein GCM10027342_20830 [Photobacterium alginatilyticum]
MQLSIGSFVDNDVATVSEFPGGCPVSVFRLALDIAPDIERAEILWVINWKGISDGKSGVLVDIRENFRRGVTSVREKDFIAGGRQYSLYGINAVHFLEGKDIGRKRSDNSGKLTIVGSRPGDYRFITAGA